MPPTLTTTVPILPGYMPGQAGTIPVYPARGPGYSIKVTSKWNNSRQQSVNGRMIVVKYWTAPLWEWEWLFDVLPDNPQFQNPLYTVNSPVPYTDYQIISSFFNDRQGGGNEFAFQPPDSVIGGLFTATTVQGTSNLWTIGINNNTIQAGLYVALSGFGTATWLNGQILQVLQSGPNYIIVYFSHSNLGLTSDAGTIFAGQILSPLDGNNNTQIVHQTGGYPILPVSGTPVVLQSVVEPVQLLDTSAVTVYANGLLVNPANYTISAANSVAGYLGLVLHFSGAQTPPITASFPYYYLCRFTEDSQEFENFQMQLWSIGSFKFEQVRI